MSDDDEDEMEKTQIFLPGGAKPAAPKKEASEEDDTGVLLKAQPSDRTKTSVDLDITGGGSRAAVTPPPAAPSSSSSGMLVAVVVIAALAAVAWFLFL